MGVFSKVVSQEITKNRDPCHQIPPPASHLPCSLPQMTKPSRQAGSLHSHKEAGKKRRYWANTTLLQPSVTGLPDSRDR